MKHIVMQISIAVLDLYLAGTKVVEGYPPQPSQQPFTKRPLFKILYLQATIIVTTKLPSTKQLLDITQTSKWSLCFVLLLGAF